MVDFGKIGICFDDQGRIVKSTPNIAPYLAPVATHEAAAEIVPTDTTEDIVSHIINNKPSTNKTRKLMRELVEMFEDYSC